MNSKFFNRLELDHRWLTKDGFSSKKEKYLFTAYILALIAHLGLLMNQVSFLFSSTLVLILVLGYTEFRWNLKTKIQYCISDNSIYKQSLFFWIANPIFLISVFLSVDVYLYFAGEFTVLYSISLTTLSLFLFTYLFTKYFVDKEIKGKAYIEYLVLIGKTPIAQSIEVDYSIINQSDIPNILEKRFLHPPFLFTKGDYKITKITHITDN